MPVIVYIIIGIIAGAGLLIIAAPKVKNGLAKRNEERRANVEAAKEKIMEELAMRESQGKPAEITNDEVEKMLGVSDATARNYLDALEKASRITQVGTDGRGVYYTLNR